MKWVFVTGHSIWTPLGKSSSENFQRILKKEHSFKHISQIKTNH